MDSEARTCWVCYNSESDSPNLSWIKPCQCRGATKWVHQHCLQRWVDEKQRGDSHVKVVCRVCTAQYKIRYPSQGLILKVMELADRIINRLCPFVVGGFCLTTLIWTGVTYGAVTIMQIMGHREAIRTFEQVDPLILLISLPTIPVFLFLFKLIPWEEFVLSVWQKYSYRIPCISKLLGSADIPEWRHNYNLQFPLSSPKYFSRILADALITPTMATVVGKFIFPRLNPKWKRNILGSIVYVLGKGFVNIIYQQMKYLRNCRRVILDFDDPTQLDNNSTTGVSGRGTDSLHDDVGEGGAGIVDGGGEVEMA